VSSTSSRGSRGSNDSHSTATTTPQSSPRCSPTKAYQDAKIFQKKKPHEADALPSTSYCDRSSTETFDSTLASDDENDDIGMGSYDSTHEIPPLPEYRRDVVDPTVRPSNPEQFGRLFPSTEKLSIRHDEFTSDGNMNLRVDMVVSGRRRVAVQLFHLRMHDLAKRKFSLRRYCRESGREVCNSERKYEGGQAPSPGAERPTLQRSVSTAFKFRRTNSGGSLFGSKSSHNSNKRPGSSSSADIADDELNEYFDRAMSMDRKKVPTNSIKLEFSNYARVDVTRKGSQNSKHYEFEWWGHSYSWKRVFDKNLRVYSFHLIRDGAGPPVAHIVPESRSPTQAQIDDSAGGWVPPCHMWISDDSVIDVPTDVAE